LQVIPEGFTCLPKQNVKAGSTDPFMAEIAATKIHERFLPINGFKPTFNFIVLKLNPL
jgi:hypothetical protein